MDAATPVFNHVEVFDKAFSLSPIQKWFFDQTPRGEHLDERHHYNQGFYVKLCRFVSPERLSVALRKVVQHHSMLRARFKTSESGWMQSAPRLEDAVYHFSSADALSLSEVKAKATRLHRSLNFERGLVFATALYHLTTESVQYLILVAHHLVIDLVSWRIILDDLEASLSDKELMPSTPFQVWTQLQAEEARSPRFSPEKVLFSTRVHDKLDFWDFNEQTSNTAHDHIVKTFEADLATTSLLLKDANTAFNSEPVDIILAALWDAFFHSFPERTGLTIFNEGHGREQLTDTAIDLSRTVGWFTTLSPIHVDRNIDNSAVHTMRLVKDARRRLPLNGLAYWVSRFLNPHGIKAFESHSSAMEVQFNYHGQFHQLERPDSLFTAIDLDDAVPATSPHMPTSVLFDINVIIVAGVVKFSFAWNRHIDRQHSILAWIAQIVPSLQSLCNDLHGRPISRTLCDFEFLTLDYSGVDELQSKILPHLELLNDSPVDYVLPCLPMVDGILLSQTKGTGSYETSQTWQIVPSGSHRIEISRLVDAWQALIARHSALRTVFIESLDATRSAFNAAVLCSHRGNVLIVESESYEEAINKLKHLPRVDYTHPRPPHRLTICSISGQAHMLCLIEISHAICDGASTAITMKDWTQAYSEELNIRDLQDVTRDFTVALAAQSRIERMAYWKDKLSNTEPCTFPRVRGHTTAICAQPNGVTSFEIVGENLKLIERFCKLQGVTLASLFQSAWTLVLSAYVASDRVCFGYLASGRQLPVKGIDQSIGAYANVMICRADLGRQRDETSLVHYIYEQILEDMAFQHCSVAEIQHELGLPSLFNTIMSFQKEESCVEEQDPERHGLQFIEVDWRDPTEYDITININQSKLTVCVTAEYRLACMDSEQARRVLSLMESTIISLVTNTAGASTATQRTLQELTATQSASVDDLQNIWIWNKMVPETVDTLVHHTIADVARSIPRAPAICAWDGDLTYCEFEAAANKLARHLVSLGVGPKVTVPLFFKKSKWMPVSMFAVMKAGAASLSIDCTFPRERLRSIVQQVHPLVVLASVAQTELAKQLTDSQIVVISQVHLDQLAEPRVKMPEVNPLDLLYIVFTSGSTGVPKGVAITHSNFSSAIQHQQRFMGFKSTSRVYDFVKYAFDVTWSNFLHTMTSGGCLCIPSETEAIDNLAVSFSKYRANFVDLTPSVASTIRPTDLPASKHVLFSGEVLPTCIGAQWAEQAIVLNTYGPAECSVKATFAKFGENESQAANIGRGVGLCTWIVQPTNHEKLVPVGVVGELLLEGPLIGAGYIGDESRTQTAFIENPPWLVRGLPHDASSGAPSHYGRCGRLYKTGDLVKYEPDGTLTFVGRNDAQVKINGQRVELGDVEYHVRSNIAIADLHFQVFAEILTPSQSDTSILMVFIHMVSGRQADASSLDRTRRSGGILTGLNERLAAILPAHMTPSAYLMLNELPMTSTGKADRRQLREMGQKLTLEQILALSSGSDGGYQPCTATERQLQHLWAQVLGIKTSDTIKTDHSFFQIGGNSIRAMKLVGLARKVGFHLTVTNIFRQPILKDMARSTGHISALDEDDIPPFSLLETMKHPGTLLKQAAELCGVDSGRIEDIYPCTPLQEGFLALTAKRAGDYTARYILPLRRSVDFARFQRAWEEVLRTTPSLRFRVVDLADQGLVQVVLDHRVQWSHHFSVSEYEEVDKKADYGLGKPLVRYADIFDPNHGQTHCFAWTIHHALYDGSSMRLIMDRLNQAYQDHLALQPAPPFNRFVRHILNIEKRDANSFWQAQFAGLEAQVFPSLPSATHQPSAKSYVVHHIEEITWPPSDITAATVIRSSWSILTARLTNSSDVVFGVTMSGRQAAVPQINEMTGPTLTTLPVRTMFDWQQSVEAYLDQVQRGMREMIPYEQTGLQNISRISNECRQACNFQSLLLIHPCEETQDRGNLLFVAHNDDDAEEFASGEFATYALTLECTLEEHGLKLKFEYDDGVIGRSRVSSMADEFEHILRQLGDPSNSTKHIAEVEVLSETELSIIWTWNATVPTTIEARVHDLIADTCLKQPHATAVHAWDGIWTYAELHDMSTRLAHHLVHLGVGCETVVPLYFEKSKWTPIAMLAVMRAGGTCVTLDPALPRDRLFKIVQQIKPSMVLSSWTNKKLSGQLCDDKPVIVVNHELQALLDKQTSTILPEVQPSQALYIVFTSGSTGTPKGVQISHSNFSAALRHQHGAHNFGPGARIYDFASYAFDVSWSNVLGALECGACLCIPTDAERRDDLAESLRRFRVTHVELTPSMASILPLEIIQSLDTLILGGERLSEEHAQEWASLVTLKNSYGPCECTPTATVANICPGGNMTTIGKGLGVNTWIVDAGSAQSLVPIGSIGELVLEGPLVGPGYLEPSTNSFSAFIEDPVWLLHGVSGRTGRKGRLYRTGDLVVYNEDGSLTFIGRKDAQVKVHGQRVELGDIENHIAQCRQVRQSACILPKTGLCANTLVGLISVKHTSETKTPLLAKHGARLSANASASSALTTGVNAFAESDPSTIKLHAEIGLEQLTTAVMDYVEALKSHLDDVLPSYMIPTIWVVVKDIPLDPSGKTNRRQLDDWLSRMNQQTYDFIADADRFPVLQQPVSEAERLLQHACSVVLNVSASNVNLARSFVANGGDSISAMRLSAHCRADITVTVANLLKSKSLVEVAQKSPVAANSTTTVGEEFNTPFALSPMQQCFFDQLGQHSVDEPGYHCNQSFYLCMNKTISVESIAAAIAKIVESHSMLRARFYQDPDNKWMQIIPQPSASTHHFETSMLESHTDLAPFAALRQQQIRVKCGLVFSADLCKVGTQEELYLLLIAHHLVVDLVSWRIILADLDAILAGGRISSQSLPFQIWNRLQIEATRESAIVAESASSTSDSMKDFLFWDFKAGQTPNKVLDYVNRTVTTDRDNTRQLLWEANNAFNTEPVDLFLAAISHAFFQIFPRNSFTIVNESHGRDTLKEDTDLSRTVGWFTTMCPLGIARSTNSNLSDMVRRVKDARKYLRDDRARACSASEIMAEMVFNYHGQFQQLERTATLFDSITLDVSDEGPDLPVSALFEVNISIEQGKTNIWFSWNRHLAHQQLIQEWPMQIVRSIRSICEVLPFLDVGQRTLVDYEFLDLDYPGLDHLESQVIPKIVTLNSTEIEDIYPCPPMVDGILLSQLKGSGTYETIQRYHVRPGNCHVIDIERLSVAWHAVVGRHPSLRSVFVESTNNSTAFNQVLLNSCRPEIKLHHSESLGAAHGFLQTFPRPHYQQLKPPHRLVICPISDTDTVLIQIDMSHAITDGESTTILLRDWQRAYAGLLARADLLETTRGFARALQPDMIKKKLYWTQKLTRVQPCYFPALHKLSQPVGSISFSTLYIDGTDLACVLRSCETNSITIANWFLAAWALTLSAYAGNTSVCFGYLASGRDLPIPDIMEAIGAFANMLTCRTDITHDWSCCRFVQYIHNQVLEDMEHQHCPLAGIQHELKIAPGQQLYNTIISIQQDNDKSLDQPADQGLEFVDADGEDPTEYDVAISIILGVTQIGLTINCAPSHCNDDQAGRILSLLRTTVIRLAKSCQHLDGKVTLGDSMMAISYEDLHDIWQWNSNVSEEEDVSSRYLETPLSASQDRSVITKAIDAESGQFASAFAHSLNGTAAKTWITGIEDNNRLVPIGCTGELVLESFTAGIDCVDSAKKIPTSFVDNPSWLLDGGGPGFHGRHGRIYQTGVLAQYNADSSLVFVGRKADQRKLRGQPVDLDKLESRMRQVPSVRQAVCVIPTLGPYIGKLVGLFSLHPSNMCDHRGSKHKPQLVSDEQAVQVRDSIQALEASMDNSFLAYMVPSVWIALEEIDVNTANHLSRKVLEEWIGHVDVETCARITCTGSVCRRPITAAEKVICHACSLVLDRPESNININRSFIANGGDSMSAMRVSPHCRAAGFAISVASLLKIKTLIGVAISATIAEPSKVLQVEDFEKPCSLSPVQQWYFNQSPPDKLNTRSHYCNQASYLQFKRRVSSQQVASAVQQLVHLHSMLRARFQLDKVTRSWSQLICKPEDGIYHFTSLLVDTVTDVENKLAERNQELNIEQGKVFAVDLFTLKSGDQFLTLIAHHLVVDLISWHIILDDLEVLLKGGSLQAAAPFQVWNNMQIMNAEASKQKPEQLLSTEVHNNLNYWGYDLSVSNTFADHEEKMVTLNQETSSLVLGKANEAYNTEPVDLILASLWIAFFELFEDRDGLTIFNEGHGREPWSSDIDISRTVGWFTTMTPLHIPRCRNNNNVVRSIKDSRRMLRSNGREYFASRYHNQDGKRAFQSHEGTMEVLFNYHGHSQLQSDDSMFKNAAFNKVSDVGPALPTSALFSINVSVQKGLIEMSFSRNRWINHQDMIRQWFQQVPRSAWLLCTAFLPSKRSLTIVDYEFLHLDYKTLDHFQGQILPIIQSNTGAAVVDVFPCPPMVNGMLLSQGKDPSAYKTSLTYEVAHGNQLLDIKLLKEAWQAVVARHPALRSVLVEGIDKRTAFVQIVLGSFEGEVIVTTAPTREVALISIDRLPEIDYQRRLVPPHRLVLCKVELDNTIICHIEMSHAITDGISTTILLDDWSKAYDQHFEGRDLLETTRSFALQLSASSKVDKLVYWKNKLTNLDPCVFPRISQDPTAGNGAISAVLKIDREEFRQVLEYCESQSVTPSSLFNSVWALTLAVYTSNDQVCFGYTASGRDLHIPNIDRSVGAYANLLICHADTSFHTSAGTQRFVQYLHAQVMEDLEYQHCSLADIEHELGLSQSQALFNTIVSFQSDDVANRADLDTQGLVFHDIAYKDPTEYDISLGIVYGKTRVELSLDSYSSCLSTTQAERTLSLLESILMSLVDSPTEADTAIPPTINQISARDLEEIWTWNHAVPDLVNALVHDLISKTAHVLPSSPAICAWDGDWTYQELDSLSYQLAQQLISMGVGPEKIVGLCFEKCRWTPIAVLAVMKAGGVSLILDLELTEDRLRVILVQAKPTVMLSSTASKDTAITLAQDEDSPMLVVDELNLVRSGMSTLADFPAALSEVKPSNTLYIVFTSGSTGVPKGVSITHSNFSSSVHYLRKEHTIESGSRVYDFAAYSFDMSWSTMLWTLECGACLCIPSPADRRDNLAESIDQFGITQLLLTPTVAQLLPLATLRGIECLVLGGEALTPELNKVFASTVKTMNHYGPCECTPVTVATNISPEDSQVSLGRGVGVVTWVVDTTRNSLVPVGCFGELLLEGPLVGPGYLNSELTAASFIHDPPWMLHGSNSHAGRRGRLYKTGDLVRYNHDGTLSYLGRKDNQTKINGQRIELGSIEYCVRSCIEQEAVHVAVELVLPRDSAKKVLVAFLSTEGGPSTGLRQATAGLSAKLAHQLPAFMVPPAFLWTESFPVMVSGKIDRGKLRGMCEHLSRQEIIAQDDVGAAENAGPMTNMERELAALWSTVLEVPSEAIRTDNSFIRLGGDSVGAMKVSAMARDNGFRLPVTEILRYPSLADQSKRMQRAIHNEQETTVPPFSLLPAKFSSTAAREQIAELCGIATGMVEDAFPCTPLQEGLLALTLQRPGSYVAQWAYELQPHIDVDRFRQAWNDTIATTPILRTRIVDLPGSGMVQVIIADQSAVWTQTSQEIDQIKEAKMLAMGLGTPLTSSEMRTSLEGRSVFVWTVHHALYDGWSITRVMRMLETAYAGVPKLQSPPPFQNFVKFIQDTKREAVRKFWTSQFEQLEAQIFPSMSSSAQPRPDLGVTYQIRELSWPSTDTTAATTIRAALAILIATYTDSSEAIFGVTVNGRQVPLPGIENIVAPTIATVPFRVKTSRESSIPQLLHQLQAQMLDMAPFEHTGLQAIRKMSPAARHACDFQTLLLVHSAQTLNEQPHTLFIEAEDEIDRDTGRVDELVTDFDTYAFTIECDLEATGALLRIKSDSRVISRDQVETFAVQFESILRQLCSSQVPELTIADLQTAGDKDLDQIWKWNASIPATVDLTVHGIIAQNAARYPYSPAVCAWDGHWTYEEVDSIATQIALGLVGHDFGPKSAPIPICFEKSRWTPVAMLAVMKAGCASVILDTTLPLSRLQAIVREVNSPVILSSRANVELAGALTDRHVIVLCEETLRSFDAPSAQVLPTVDASANLYLVFTSGSTGTPKAAVITHSNFSSAIYHQQAATGFSRSSRVCDLAKYAFDISWSNFVHTLAAGGCLCIPSQQEISNDLAGALRAYEANFMDITPSVAGVLQPSDLGGIQTVVFAGETLPSHIASQWAPYARVLNMYGPAECTAKATMAAFERYSATSSASCVGRGLGLCTWVVDSQDHQRLIPIGAIGELLLEGPLVGAGYYKDTERTKASFIDSPEWLTRGNGTNHKGRQGRLYKTGDLVSYSSDGSLNFIGRKDAQTKINGQRLELGDVEQNLGACIDADLSGTVAAEVLTPRDGDDKPMLVAFVQTSHVRGQMIGLQDRLAARLPPYMIPSAYIQIEELPLSSSGKMDRKQLRAIGAGMTRHELTKSLSTQAERRTPSTDHELCLQKLWSLILRVRRQSISADDSFLYHGGDSIQAMKLTMRARHEGLDLCVADILGNPKLSQMALRMQPRAGKSSGVEVDYRPFSLLLPASQQPIKQQLIEYGLSLDNVSDILPVTDQQARYILGTYTTARSSVFYHTMDLDDEFDLPKIQHALDSLLEQFDMLRTVVIPYKNTFLQIVLKFVNSDSTVSKTVSNSLDEHTLHLKSQDLLSDLHFGDVVTRIFIVRQTREQKHRIVVRLSHVQYDGIALEKMWAAFEDSYNNSTVSVKNARPSFAHHLHSLSLLDRKQMSEYWRKLLKGSSRTELKHHTTFQLGYATGPEVVKTLPAAMINSDDFTFANVLKASWAYVLARHLAINDVVFGSLVHGRSQAGSQDVFGACIDIIPYRIILEQDWTARDLLTAVSAQQLASTRYESMGGQSIIRDCTDWAKWSFFSSVIIHQNFEQSGGRGRAVDLDRADLSTGDVDDVQVYVISTPGEGGMEILLSFKDGVVSQATAEGLTADLSDTITGFYTKMDDKLMSPTGMHRSSALLPLPEEKSSSNVSPTSGQLTALAECSADVRAALGAAWCDVLSTQETPCDNSRESLFDLGGDASSAGQLAGHMQRRGYAVRIEEILEHPSWFELLLHLSQQQREWIKGNRIEGASGA